MHTCTMAEYPAQAVLISMSAKLKLNTLCIFFFRETAHNTFATWILTPSSGIQQFTALRSMMEYPPIPPLTPGNSALHVC